MKSISKEEFEVEQRGQIIKIEVSSIGGQSIYKASFSNDSLFLTRGRRANGELFWTSVPEGRQEIAEKIGALIEQHYKAQ